MIQPANRLQKVEEYYFSRKLKEVARLNKEGLDIISLAIGSPDMPPSQQTVDKLCEVARTPSAHGYQPTMGTPELRQAIAAFYDRWYGVSLDAATEVLPLIGSKEGILHVTLALVNPGDKVLVPNPGYPTYTSLSRLLGAEVMNYDLQENDGWQPFFRQDEKHQRLGDGHQANHGGEDQVRAEAGHAARHPPHGGPVVVALRQRGKEHGIDDGFQKAHGGVGEQVAVVVIGQVLAGEPSGDDQAP